MEIYLHPEIEEVGPGVVTVESKKGADSLEFRKMFCFGVIKLIRMDKRQIFIHAMVDDCCVDCSTAELTIIKEIDFFFKSWCFFVVVSKNSRFS